MFDSKVFTTECTNFIGNIFFFFALFLLSSQFIYISLDIKYLLDFSIDIHWFPSHWPHKQSMVRNIGGWECFALCVHLQLWLQSNTLVSSCRCPNGTPKSQSRAVKEPSDAPQIKSSLEKHNEEKNNLIPRTNRLGWSWSIVYNLALMSVRCWFSWICSWKNLVSSKVIKFNWTRNVEQK